MNIAGKELKDIELIKVKDLREEIIVANCDISGISIKRTEFYDTAVSISDSNISKCKMSQSYFKESKVSNCQINGSDLSGTEIRNVSMNDCQISSCKSKKSNINYFDATNVSVKRIKSTETDVHNMVCNQCEFTDINASISAIGRCKFVDCVFDKIVIEKMYCPDNLFENCTFKDVTLQGKFKKVKFVNIDFTSMDLERLLFIDCEYENCKYRDDQKGILIDYNLLSDDEIKAIFYAYNEAGKGSNLTDFITCISKDRWTLDMVRITVDWYIKVTLERRAIIFLDDCVDMYKDDMALWHYQYALASIGAREYLTSIEHVIKAFESSNGIEHEIASYKKLSDAAKSARDILNESFVDRFVKAEERAEVERLCAQIEEMYDSLVSANNSKERDSEEVSQDIEVNEGDSISILNS